MFNLLAVQGNQDVKEKKAKRKEETTSGEFSEKHESERILDGRGLSIKNLEIDSRQKKMVSFDQRQFELSQLAGAIEIS